MSLRQLSLLQVLRLSGNRILDLSKAAFHGLTGLQSLDLSRNRIEVLQFAQFSGLSGLRSVDLSHNRLRSLPRDVFESTAMESVDLVRKFLLRLSETSGLISLVLIKLGLGLGPWACSQLVWAHLAWSNLTWSRLAMVSFSLV